jgi:hypothetical protein
MKPIIDVLSSNEPVPIPEPLLLFFDELFAVTFESTIAISSISDFPLLQ